MASHREMGIKKHEQQTLEGEPDLNRMAEQVRTCLQMDSDAS